MGHTDAEYIFIFVAFFGLIGFVAPFIALEFGGTIANFNIESVGEAAGFGVLNAFTSILFWTFGLPVYINIVFIAIKVMMFFIVLRNTPLIGTGGS
jgi:hypothetical protein